MTTKKEKTCTCETGSGKCGCGCGCDKDTCTCGRGKLIIKSGVMLASAVLIAGAILTAGYDGGMNCDKGSRSMGDKMGKMGEKRDAMIQDYIMKNPKVLIDSVEAYYKSQEAGAKGGQGAQADGGCGGDAAAAAPSAPTKAPEMQQAPKDLVAKIVADKSNHVLGNPNGSFVIIEFFDYQCGWCKKTNQQIGEAIKTAKNIRWILIDTPIFGEASETISRYALAAGNQGKFKEFHEAIMTSKDRLDEPALIQIGKNLKLDTKKLTADANGAGIKAKMESNKEFTKALNIGGVPMVIVDGKINPGALINERLAAAVKASNEKK